MPREFLPTKSLSYRPGQKLDLEPHPEVDAALREWTVALIAAGFEAHYFRLGSPYVFVRDPITPAPSLWLMPDGRVTRFADPSEGRHELAFGRACLDGFSPTADEVVAEAVRMLRDGGRPKPGIHFGPEARP